MKTPPPRDDYPVCGNCGAAIKRCNCDGCGPTAAIAFALILAFAFVFTFDRCSTVARGDEIKPTPSATVVPKIVTPPGPPQIITPPLVTPTPAPPLTPTVEDDSPKIEIVATIGGEIITEHPVKLPIGRKLTLVVKGVKGFEPGPVTWSLNEVCSDADADPTDSHRMTFSAPIDSVKLFTASCNNPDAKLAPIVVQKWVVIGLGPQPPPDVVPPKPPVVVDPVDPPDDSTKIVGPFRALIVRDTDSDGELPKAQRDALQAISVSAYLNAHCVKEPDATPSWRNWDDSYTDEQITDRDWRDLYRKALTERQDGKPWVCIWDNAGKLIGSSAFPGTEPDALAYLRKFGGN